MNIRRLSVISLILTISILLISCASTQHGKPCESSVDYVVDVYSSGNGVIEYRLDPNINYQSMTIVFFAKRGMTLRNNTIVRLDKPSGTIRIPESVFIPPAQRWFNFVVTDMDGCRMWGLVNETPLQREGNIIGIDIPTPGERHAFVLK